MICIFLFLSVFLCIDLKLLCFYLYFYAFICIFMLLSVTFMLYLYFYALICNFYASICIFMFFSVFVCFYLYFMLLSVFLPRLRPGNLPFLPPSPWQFVLLFHPDHLSCILICSVFIIFKKFVFSPRKTLEGVQVKL